jgi:hypothetical protein
MADSRCQCDPALKEQWGCEGSTQAAVWIDSDDTEYFICPIRLLTEDILEWYESYVYYQDFGGAPIFENQGAKYIEAIKVYKSYLSHYTYEMTPKGKDGYTAAKQILRGNTHE